MKRILAGLTLIGLAAAVMIAGSMHSPTPAHRALRREAVSLSAVVAWPTFGRSR